MLKRSMLALCMTVLLALGACGSPDGKNSGLLTDEEIGKYESLYLTESGAALSALGFAEKDIDKDSEGYEALSSAGAYPVKAPRSMAGVDFRQVVLTSVSGPEGLYGVRFYANFMEEDEAAAAMELLRKQAEELYGQPLPLGQDSWEVGGMSEMYLSFFDAQRAANFSPDWNYRYSIEVSYGIRRVVDGKLLSGEEMSEMVRDIQQN